MLARGQIGWQDPGRVIDINFFANYRSHYFNRQAVPPTPTLENWLGVPQGSLSGAALAAANQKLMLVPRFVTFDVSIGYNLGERTSNRWLQGTQLRLTVNNIFDKQPPFYYRTNNDGAGPVAFDPTNFSPQGRIIAIQATKNW